MLWSHRVAKYPVPFGRNLLLLERINVGGMAEVFRAKSFGIEGFERIVAVKRILPTLAGDEEFISMFIDEARIAAHLTHQNVVQIYELGKHAGTYFISMEYVAGRDLRQILDRQKRLGLPMDETTSAFIVARVCEALDYAHRKKDPAGRDLGIIHRDVTPQNVIVSYQGEVKLCDFGIAKAATRVSRTQVGVLKGKFAYMAPEQVQGRPVDRRGDIFSLGVIFYELLTGERLFIGDTDYATLEAVREANIPPPRAVNPNIPDGMEAIVLRMLARDPDERYAWASDVHEDLLEVLVKNGQLFQIRHLREWMQTTYAQALELENAKMEAFLQLQRPVDELTERLSEEGIAGSDPDLTADYPALPAAVMEALQPTGGSAAYRTSGRLGESPVSNLFGTPHVEESNGAPSNGESSMVRPASARNDFFEELDLHERTVFDSFDPSNENETVNNEALGTTVSEAQAEIRSMLGDDVLPQLDEMSRLEQTLGAEDTQAHAFIPDSEVDRTSVETRIPQATVESVFSMTEDTSSGLVGDGHDELTPALMSLDEEDESASPPPLPGAPTGPAESPRAPGRSLLRSSPVREVNAVSALPDDGPGAPTGPVPVGPRPGERRPPPIPPHSSPPVSPSLASRAGSQSPAPGPSFSGPVKTKPATPSGGSARAIGSRVGGLPARAVASQAAAHPAQPKRSAPSVLAQSIVAPVGAAVESLGRPAVIAIGVVVGLLLLAAFVLLLQPREASLKILSKPIKGAQVFVDNHPVGETPVRVARLSLGRHLVRIEAPGYRRYTQTIRILARRPHTMMVPLEAMVDDPATLPKGATSSTAAISLGDDPGADGVAAQPVAAPAPPVTTIERGALLVTTRPSGVAVWIDGEDTGLRTPIREPFDISAGEHVLTFVTDDGLRYHFAVVVRRGAPTRVDRTLE